MEFAALRGLADIQAPVGPNPEKDKIEQKTEELILMTGAQGPRRWRQRKGEYLRKLEQDNLELKNLIVELQQQISANQAQKDILRDQLTYFQSCLAQAAPLVFQPAPDRPQQPPPR
jgi:hypothetical protein